MEYSKKLENILIKLNKISQLDIYVYIEDNLLLIDIYIDYPNKDLFEYVMNTTKDTLVYLDEYKIIKGMTKVSFESKELDKESSNKIYNLFNVTKARLDISFYELDKYLFDKNILVKRILRNQNIYYLEFAIDEERKYAYNYLNNEKVIGIFPEGTIGRNGILPFKSGVIKMGMETDCEIVPFAITGDYKLFSNNLKIEFGKQIKIKSNDIKKETEKLRNTIIDMIGGK